ncbi:MAG: ATP-binding protein [Myxococcota bacterium]
MINLVRRYLEGRLGSDLPLELGWKVRVFGLACLVLGIAVLVIAINQGNQGQVTVAAGMSALTLVIWSLPRFAHDAQSLMRVSHALIGMCVCVVVGLSIIRGGLSSPLPMALALVPVLSGILLGARMMMPWSMVALVSLLALGLVPQWMGISLSDHFSVEGQAFSGYFSPIVMLLIMVGLIRMMLQLQGVALDAARVAERERVVAERSAEQRRTEHMAMVGQLAVGVAHEVNNPLAYVVGNVSFVIDALRSNESEEWGEAIDALQDAADGAERIARIVTRLNAHGRDDEDQAVPISLRDSVEAALHIASNQLRHRARIVRNFDADPIVEADAHRLTQVFLNMLINSAHAIPTGEREANEISVSVQQRDDEATVEIVDTGEGIDPKVLPRITEPFFTTKEVGRGTGLGLSISRSIIERYEGNLEISSELGVGTCIRVRFPLCRKLQLEAVEDSERVSDPDEGMVLVIDDDPLVRKTLGRMLPGRVVEAGDVRQAIGKLERGEVFHAILCDVMMPDQTGVDFYHQLERSYPASLSRLLFFSGGVFEAEAQKFFATCSIPVLQKPLDRKRLLQALDELPPLSRPQELLVANRGEMLHAAGAESSR